MARPYIGGTNGGVVNCDAARTLGKSDSGKTFYVTDTGSSGYTITLPTPSNAGIGWNAKFVVNCAAGSTLSNSGGEDVVLNDGQTDVMVVHYIDVADASTAGWGDTFLTRKTALDDADGFHKSTWPAVTITTPGSHLF